MAHISTLIPKKYSHSTLWQVSFFFILLWPYLGMGQSHQLDSLKTSFEAETNDSLKIIYEIQLVREIHNAAHHEKTEYEYAQDAIQRALNLKDTLLYARALDNLGLLYRYHQYYDSAIPLHIKAFNLIEHKDVAPIYKMIFANNAGVASRYNQEYDTSIFYYMNALKIAEHENNIKNIAISSNGIGNALGNIPGREDEALGYFKTSLKAERKSNDSLGVAMNYLSIAHYYINKEQFERALDYLNKLLKNNQTRNDLFGLAITYEFFGKSYLAEGKNLKKAAAYFQNALDRFKNQGNRRKQAEIQASLGDIKSEQNRTAQALELYQNSLNLAKNMSYHGLIMENSFKLAKIHEKNNRSVEALQYFKQGHLYKDSINLTKQNVEIAALIRKYNIEQKENHIQLLQKDKALQQTLLENQEQKLERRRISIVLMAIGLLFILIIFLLQYRNSQIKKKTTARIQKEEKEKMKAIYERNLARAEILVTRLRINPHFLFNSLNAITYLIQSEQNAKAMKYLVVFSRYARMVLETSQKYVVPLTEELQLTSYYLTLEENRFEKDFTYRIIGADVPELEKVFIPPLLLQPSIENAIWHGLLPSKRDKKILLLEVIPQGNNIKIIIDDNGVGRKKTPVKTNNKDHESMGIQIIQERVDLYNKSYPSKIEYEVIDKTNKNGQPAGTRIVFNLIQKQPVEK